MAAKQWFFYVLTCSDQSLYAGVTTDVEKRVKLHNKGKGSKYVRSRLPAHLLYFRKMPNKSKAFSFEKRFKSLTKSQKLKKLCDMVDEDLGLL